MVGHRCVRRCRRVLCTKVQSMKLFYFYDRRIRFTAQVKHTYTHTHCTKDHKVRINRIKIDEERRQRLDHANKRENRSRGKERLNDWAFPLINLNNLFSYHRGSGTENVKKESVTLLLIFHYFDRKMIWSFLFNSYFLSILSIVSGKFLRKTFRT